MLSVINLVLVNMSIQYETVKAMESQMFTNFDRSDTSWLVSLVLSSHRRRGARCWLHGKRACLIQSGRSLSRCS